MIRLDEVTVAYGRTIALDDLTLSIDEGVTGLFGPNGSGKSTLLRTIAGLLSPTRGRIFLDGAPLDLRDENARRKIGYAGHQAGLYNRLSVEENLVLFARLYGIPRSRAAEMTIALGLSEHAGTPVGSLSAGYARRAAVARAMLHDPDILLLDEPYANLDDEASRLVSEAVVGWRETGKVALVATHGAKKVKAYADSGLILKQGHVARHGSYHPVEVQT